MKNTIILILSLLVIGLGSYVIFDKVIDKKIDNDTNETNANIEQDDKEENNILISNDDIKLKSLNIEKYNVDENGVNTKISVTGKIDLEFDENKYEGVTLSGYCLDSNDTKYFITGPADGRALYHSGMSDLSLSEDLMSSVTYKDGTSKSIREISWKDVSLKTCKVEKITGFLKESSNNQQQSNYDKVVSKLKDALTDSNWINENLYSKENVFGNSIDRTDQELKFEVLHDSKNYPIVIVEDISYDKALIVCYKVFVDNDSVIVKNITGDIGHSGHMHFGIDKNQGIVFYIWMHMGNYSFKAYDVKEKEIKVYDEYNCNTGRCEEQYKGNKTYNESNISIEMNNENIENYVK